MVDKVVKDDALWKAELPPERYAILRQAATEPPWTGELLAEKREGVYSCAGCGNELFASDTKFESGSGWPSFFDCHNTRCCGATRRPEPRNGAHRGGVWSLRRTPRPPV